MLEKNKDYIEMRVSSTDCAFTQNAATTISIEGFSYNTSFRLPDPGESYVIISKEKFEKLQESVVYYMALSTRAQYWKDKCEQLQADNEHYREMAKQWESNYGLLLEKTGFTSVEDLIDYICDPSMTSPEDKTLKEIIDECEKDYISERDKAEALQTENEQLKKKLAVPDPLPEFREFLEKLYSKDDAENLEWVRNYICGGQVSVNGWEESAKFWKKRYDDIFKLVGFSSKEEVEDYLVNKAECDTLHEAILKLIDENKYACEEWCSANSSNNSWKAAAECNSPKELIEKRETLEKEIEVYSRTLKEWKEITGCPSPSAAKSLIESGESWHHAYNEIKEVNKKLADSIKAWQNVTGDATPEDYLASMIKNTAKTVLSWQEITGFSTPEKCSSYIDTLEKKLEDIKDLIEED